MESLAEIQNEIEEEFSLFDDWQMRYEHLIELGQDLPVIDEKYKTEEYLVKGCQSRVWLRADENDGLIVFTADSDAIITKGLVALLVRVLSNRTPEEIVDCDMEFIDRIGMKEHLSPTRSNGLVSMIKQMKMFALAIKVKNNG